MKYYPVVLAYHRVVSKVENRNFPEVPGSILDISLTKFYNQVNCLSQQGYTIRDPIDLITGNFNSEKDLFISFDDGYKKTIENVNTIFQGEKCAKAIMFVTGKSFSSFKENFDWDADHPDRKRCEIVKFSDLYDLNSFRFGWHSWNHKSFRDSNCNYKYELSAPKEEMLLNLFAWPFGNVRKDVTSKALLYCEKHFKMGFTLFGGYKIFEKKQSKAIIPRLYVSKYWSQNEFISRVNAHLEAITKINRKQDNGFS